MKLSLHLIVSLFIVAALAAITFTFVQAERENVFLQHELSGRATTLAESLQMPVRSDLRLNKLNDLRRVVQIFGNRQRLQSTVIFDPRGKVLASTPGSGDAISSLLDLADKAMAQGEKVAAFEPVDGKKCFISAVPLRVDNRSAGTLVLVFDASFIGEKLAEIWKDNFLYFLFQAVMLITATVLVVRWSIVGPIGRMTDWLREHRTGKKDSPAPPPRGDILAPLVEEAGRLVKSLSAARAAAQNEARLRMANESLWTAEKLKEQVKQVLDGKTLLVASNREPYAHVRKGRGSECIVPSGGLVTALDPVLRACGGIWVAHGAGDMDRETADQRGKLRVPPEDPSYTLKRIWLSGEEEEGYYYGFSNEGLWPLCHITHTRPTFRLNDWMEYQKVNEKFARALLEEISEEKEPLILVQDYHLALLPLLLKSRRPDARIALFWHIPWPNPEAFGICPWKEEILLGMMGADLIGFHVQFHCNNFLETVDNFLESRIDREHFCIERQGTLTWVKPFPISVAFPASNPQLAESREALRRKIFNDIGVYADFLGLGVDRIDYTKGIVERLRAVERFLETHPEYRERFVFVELGAPSRTHIQRYHDLVDEIERLVEEVNRRFQTSRWKPVILLKEHHNHQTIHRYYRASDLCMVTSLHDGMNLVSKEFVSCREDEQGVLILSRFTGAARELQDALIVNPYDIEEMASAIHRGLTMPAEEQEERMRRMRGTVKDRNVYRWAGNLISSLARIRIPEPAETRE